MNYRIFIDSRLIYDSALNDEKWQIFNTKLELELNKTNSFEFTIYPIHPMYSAMNKLKSIVEVYQNGDLVFKGRILNDEIGFYNEKKVICEGDLAFLLDSLQSPLNFQMVIYRLQDNYFRILLISTIFRLKNSNNLN